MGGDSAGGHIYPPENGKVCPPEDFVPPGRNGFHGGADMDSPRRPGALAETGLFPGSREGKMTFAEYENLLLLADRMIASNNLKKAEYGRGYKSGISMYFDDAQLGSLPETPDHYYLAEVARKNGSRDVHAYVRGYRDGCKGRNPEYTG